MSAEEITVDAGGHHGVERGIAYFKNGQAWSGPFTCVAAKALRRHRASQAQSNALSNGRGEDLIAMQVERA